MTNKLPRDKFPIITAITDELSALNNELRLTTKTKSICLGRIQLDKSTNQNTLALSCIQTANIVEKKFYIYLIEQHGLNKSLEKYSFKLTDKNKVSLKQYDRDPRSGSHIHLFINGKKVGKHIPFSDSIRDIAKDIINQIAQK